MAYRTGAHKLLRRRLLPADARYNSTPTSSAALLPPMFHDVNVTGFAQIIPPPVNGDTPVETE